MHPLRKSPIVVSLLLAAGLCRGGEYPCPAWPPADSPFWQSMSYRLQPTPEGTVVVAEGQIGPQEAQRLKAQIKRAMAQSGGVSEVWFNSPGGDSAQGQEMGRAIRTLGVPTRIRSRAFCVSACSVAFLGGVFRTVESGGAYTVHMFSNFSGYSVDQALQNRVKDLQSLEQDAAQHAADRYEYLLEMGISPSVAKHGFSVKNRDASCPPLAILKQWNVDNAR
jgi:hypothetical protein